MSRKFRVVFEIEMPDECREYDAAQWGAAMLSMLSPNHPWRPRFHEAKEIAQPPPRKSS